MTAVSQYHITKDQMQRELKEIEAAKADPKKFGVIYERYYEQIFMFIFQRVESMDEAGDVASQVFLKAMTNLKKFEFRGLPFASWLYRIARNEVNQHFRKENSSKVVNVDTSALGEMIDELDSNEDKDELVQKLIQAIRELEDGDIEILELRYFEKRPFREVGDILGITENNAKVRLYRTLDKLKKVVNTKEQAYG